jgi:PAS domain S-box-containing protein
VVEGKQLVGLLTERDFVKFAAIGMSLEGVKVADVMTRNLVRLSASEYQDIFTVLNLFRHYHIRHLPIVDEHNQVVGLVTPESIRYTLQPGDLLRWRRVGEVMNASVIHASPSTSVMELARLMAMHRVSSVVITQETPNQALIPIGIVTERDIVQFQTLELDFLAICAQQVMSSPLFCLDPGESLWAAHQQMLERCVQRLVVTNPMGELIGIVTQTSLLQALDPMEMYHVIDVLQQEVFYLQQEKLELLKNRNIELEKQVQERTVKLQKQAQQKYLLAKISARICQSLDLEEILNSTVIEIRHLLQCDRALIYQFLPDRSGIVVAESVAVGWTSMFTHQITDSYLQQVSPAIFQDWKQAIHDVEQANLTSCHLQLLEHYQVKANLAVPIGLDASQAEGSTPQVWGLLVVHQCSTPRRWQDSELSLLEQLTVQIAIAIRQANAFHRLQDELTQRQKLEAALRDSEAQYRQLFQLHPSPLWVYDTKTMAFLAVNQAAIAHYGYSREEFLSMTIADIQLPSDKIAPLPIVAESTEHLPYSGIGKHCKRDGTIIEVELNSNAITWAEKQARVILAKDISDRKRAEAALQNLVAGTANVTGEDFFPELVHHLVSSLGCGHALVSRQIDEQFQTLAFWSNHQLQPNFNYTIAGTPCELTQEQGFYSCSSGIQQTFPNALGIQILQAESYMGVALMDSEGKAIGTLCILDNKPLIEPQRCEAILRIFGARAGAELERQRATQALQQLNEELETRVQQRTKDLAFQQFALDQSAIVAITDANGIITYANDKLCEIAQYSQTELIGQTHTIFNASYHDQTFFQNLWTTVANGQVWKGEVKNQAKDGRFYWVDTTIVPALDHNGKPSQYFGISFDITERKLTEEALWQSEARFRSLFEAAPDSIHVLDLDGVIWQTNPATVEQLGYSETELVGYRLIDFLTPYSQQLFTEQLQTLLATEISRQELEFIHKDGTIRFAECSSSLVRNEQGELTHIVTIHRDISDRKQAEVALRSSQERLQYLLSSNPTIIYSCKAYEDKAPTFVSETIFTILGYKPEECLVEKDWWIQRIHPEDKPRILTDYPLLFECGHHTHEYRFLHKDGTYIWIRDELKLVRDTEGNPLEIIGSWIDITQRKQVEEELQQRNQLLKAISTAQSQFIADANAHHLFNGLLDNLLTITNSEYGFIGEVFYSDNGEPYIEEAYMKMRSMAYLKAHAITNIAWNEEMQKYYEKNATQGMEFHNLQTLFGAVIVTGKPVISNNPKTDSRRGGLPEGHPPLNSFLGLPFYNENKLLGMVGIANRPGGYEEDLIDYLQPFLSTCANIIEAYRNDKRRQQAEQGLKQQLAAVEAAIDGVAILNEKNEYIYLNQAHVELFGYTTPAELLGKQWDQLYYPEEQSRIEQNIFPLILQTGHWRGEAIAKKQDGSVFAEEISLTLIDGVGLICVCRDITERKRTQASLEKRDRYLTALVEVQRRLLASPVDKRLYDEIFSILGPVSDASRIYVFENHQDATGQLFMSQKAEWCAVGISSEIENLVLQSLSYNDFFPRWFDALNQGDIIQGIVADFPESERLVLEPQGILSIVILPLIVSGKFFGFIGFDSCLEARAWEPLEVSLLSSAAAAIALAKERELTEQAWRQAQAQLQAVLDAVPGLVSWISSDLHYLGVNHHLASCYHLPPERFIGQKVGYLEENQEFVQFLHQFFDSSIQTDSRSITIILNGNYRNYLIIAQKYQNGEVCVSVGIDITERQKAEERLKNSLKEKEVLLKEIHHRVKNNLYVVSSLLELQSDSISEPKVSKLFAESQNRIYSMALIHEKLYRSQDLAQINLSDYLEGLVFNLFDSYNVNEEHIQLQLNSESIYLNIETATPCGLIVNELVSNTMKHAFPDDREGTVVIECHQHSNQEIHLIISDNGIGFPENLDFQDTESMGFQVVCTLIEQLEGTIELDRTNGTTFHLRFSELQYQKRL